MGWGCCGARGLSPERSTDWRALQRWLLGRFTLTDVMTDTALPPGTDPREAFDLIRHGRQELDRLLHIVDTPGTAEAA